MSLETSPGQSYPLGATVFPGGVNFCVFSKNCTAIELLLFDDPADAVPSRVIPLDPDINKTFYYWHIFVPGVRSGQLYGYRVHGPFEPEAGHRFDGSKLLIDPYAREVAVSPNYSRGRATQPGDNCGEAIKSVIVDPNLYDWENDRPLRTPYPQTVIYELHVGGFTKHPSSGVAPEIRGTYAGLMEKIPYLKSLGVTAVELLPVQQFDPYDAPGHLTNYWGYSPIAFFAPYSGYSSLKHPLGPINEFRDMVKALHRAGIEVILDVVFNHTAEGNENGPIMCYRGFENRAYYILEYNQCYYSNYSGCGNTLNTNHSIVRRMILDCLRYWVAEMHIDGFRFDLASVLSRDEWGTPLKSPPILWEIESDPILAETKIIAEAWDAGGLYQVGSFVGHRWAEWNGLFRDDVRKFVKGDPGMVGALAARLAASPDVYPQPNREPTRSINFITCHDGFTLNDLVSYNDKHNEANGEYNRDGSDSNISWNCGQEGPSDNPDVEALRLQQIKNFLTIMMIAQGTPMLLMGDEVRRTQWGNNNAYCQDNELSWFDWENLNHYKDLLRFVTHLVKLARQNEIFHREHLWVAPGSAADIHVIWHGRWLYQPDWSAESRSLAFSLRAPEGHDYLYAILNAHWDWHEFQLPELPDGMHWHRVIDTSCPAPNDFLELDESPVYMEFNYWAAPRTCVLLLSHRGP